MEPALDQALVERLTAEIAERGQELRTRITSVTDTDVLVVAVTKGHPPEAAAAAVAAGFADLGENYAQEMLAKVDLVTGARWHFVGQLQTNKVRALVGHVTLWQSVDRSRLVEEIARRQPAAPILVQVDLAGTEGRAGVPRTELSPLVALAERAGLEVRGLMGVADPDPLRAREAFSWMAAAARDLDLTALSMGMSQDLELALEAGATMVRVGTALLGPRPR